MLEVRVVSGDERPRLVVGTAGCRVGHRDRGLDHVLGDRLVAEPADAATSLHGVEQRAPALEADGPRDGVWSVGHERMPVRSVWHALDPSRVQTGLGGADNTPVTTLRDAFKQGSRPVLMALAATAFLLAGCSGGNPVQAQADVATGGLTAGNGAQVTAALAAASTSVKAWQIENGALPTAAEFASIPGAATSGGASVVYVAAADGFCLTATSSGAPVVVRVWREPGGLQPAGAVC